MAKFVYKAVSKVGKQQNGNIEAEDKLQALERLKGMGLMPIEVKEAHLFNTEITFDFTRKIRAKDLSVFCRQFVSMLSAGITIIDALGMLAQQTENKAMQRAIREVQKDIGKGETLSASMGKHGKIFPDIMLRMVTAGEASGKLETTFLRMAEHFEKEEKLQGMMRKAAVYPVIVALVMVIILIIMLVKIVPSYADLFEDLQVDMPAVTLFLINVSQFIISYWYILIAAIAGMMVLIRVYAHSEQGKRFFGNITRKMPIFGKLNVKTTASIFARTLSTLLYAGLSMVESLEIVAGTMTNVLYADALKLAKEEVIKGVPLSEPLEKSELFPPMVSHMMQIGEETGEMEEVLNRLANYYDEEVEQTTQTVMAALEPLIIIVMALFVVFLIVAVMSPMMSMYSGLDQL